MPRKGLWILPSLLLLFALGCNMPGGETAEETEPPQIVTVVVTATNPPEATEEPAPDEIGSSATARQDLNVRGGPGTGYDITDFLAGGQTVPVIGKTSDGSWLQVEIDGNTGWVSAYYTDATDLSAVPVVDTPIVMADSGGDSSSPTEDGAGGSSGGSGSGQTAPSDSNISDTLNIKNDSKFYNDVISYPSGDTQDQVYINIQGFDSITTSGYVNYSLNCTGTGVANVVVTGGGDCNSAWTEFYTNDSHQETIKIYLDSGSNAYVEWTLVVSANN
ncbi:MAG: SH3 domain-containing protein [Anaerolineales bacterium]|jgi:hypothetical protein